MCSNGASEPEQTQSKFVSVVGERTLDRSHVTSNGATEAVRPTERSEQASPPPARDRERRLLTQRLDAARRVWIRGPTGGVTAPRGEGKASRQSYMVPVSINWKSLTGGGRLSTFEDRRTSPSW